MIVAVDANVLLDVLLPDPAFVEASRAALLAGRALGGLVVSPIVLAEVGGQFETDAELERFLRTTGIAPSAMATSSCRDAGARWRAYARGRGAHRRDRIVPDFMVGAHALHHAEALLTRDRSFYRTHFPTLKLLR